MTVDNHIAAPTVSDLPANPRPRTDLRAARRNDLLRSRLIEALRYSGRFTVQRNVCIQLTSESRREIRRSGGSYIGSSLPCGEGGRDTAILDIVVVDGENRWAGGYALCWKGSHSIRARRRIERDLRAAELVLRSHLRRSFGVVVDTVTVGIIDGGVEASQTDDLTISVAEIGYHFDVPFPACAWVPHSARERSK